MRADAQAGSDRADGGAESKLHDLANQAGPSQVPPAVGTSFELAPDESYDQHDEPVDQQEESEEDGGFRDGENLELVAELGGETSSLYGMRGEEQGSALSRTTTADDDCEDTFRLCPPTPSSIVPPPSSLSDPTSFARVTAIMPDTSRRISFNSSVRISGGIRSSHRRPPLHTDLFSPSPPSSASNLDHRTDAYARTRSVSPSGRQPRDASNSSSQLGPERHGSTNTSGFPSRSSSPCSSIYAPLQPPSNTVPTSTMFVPRPMPGASRDRDGSGLRGFRDYLLGGGDGSSDEEEVDGRRMGYRSLLEAQRIKKLSTTPKSSRHRLKSGGAGKENDNWSFGSILNFFSPYSSSSSTGSRGGGFGQSYGTLPQSTPGTSGKKGKGKSRRVNETPVPDFLGEGGYSHLCDEFTVDGVASQQGGEVPKRERSRTASRRGSTLSLGASEDTGDEAFTSNKNVQPGLTAFPAFPEVQCDPAPSSRDQEKEGSGIAWVGQRLRDLGSYCGCFAERGT